MPYTVDANGNLTARGPDSCQYDQQNRLVGAHVGQQVLGYTYDGDGTRTSRTLGGVPVERFVYDVNAGLPMLLQDGQRKYVYGLGLVYADELSGIAVYHTDGLGSVRAITDAQGLVVQTYQTDAFGVPEATGTAGTSTQPLQYTGEPRDAETGFVYLRARMYDSTLGRFLQKDPLRTSGPGSGGWNRYTYVGNNPASFSDPSGLKPMALRANGSSALAEVPANEYLTIRHELEWEELRDSGRSYSYFVTWYQAPEVRVINQASELHGLVFSGLAGQLGLRPEAIVLDSNTILARSVIPAPSTLLRHELGHILQAREMEREYLPTYIRELVALELRREDLGLGPDDDVARYHPMEINANRRAGLDTFWGRPHP